VASPPTPTVPLDEAQTPVEPGDGSPAVLNPGTRIGRYLVVDKIGEGGAGAVYAAFDAKLDRKVALKLLQQGSGGPMSTLDPRWPKLVQEARMLAKLSDPEVVTVFDVGEHGGVGYLAMELVEGGDLAEWIERHRSPEATEPLGLRDALRLMLEAGEGLACAHRAGLVHGDFKPANVLIDGRGRAKVSDFGIARLRGNADLPATDEQTLSDTLGSGSGEVRFAQGRTEDTGVGVRWIGTPAFMAPEQFDGVLPSEQTDVYAYCTALFQAVYGVLPWSASSMLELATLKGHRPANRRAGVRVPRWLDRLLERGLATDPDARDTSMDAVLLALRRGMRSRRTAAVVAGAGGLALLGGTAPLWLPAGAEADALCETDGFVWSDAAQARVKAAFEAVGHRAPQEAWTRVDERLQALESAWTDAWATTCRASASPTVQQRSLDCLERQKRQASRLLDAWTEEGALTVELVDRASRAAAGLPGPEVCLRADALAQGDRVPADPELAAAVSAARERIDEASGLARAGRVKDAVPVAQAALKAAEATAFAPVVAEASLELGLALERSGDIEGAAEALERAYFEGVSAEAHPLVAASAEGLVWVAGARLERHDEGMLWAQHAEAALAKTGGARDRLMAHVAGLYERKGEYRTAEQKFEEALEVTADDDLYGLGIVHQRLGDVLRRQNKADAAIEHYRETVALWTTALGASHPNVAIAKSSLGSGLARAGRSEEAVAVYLDALKKLEAAFGEDHPAISAALQNLGITYKNQGRYEEAEGVLRRAAKIDAAVFGPEHMKTADRREALGRVLTRRGRGAEALVEHVAAGKVYAETLKPGHPWLVLNHINQGDALRQMRDFEGALEAYERGYDVGREGLEDDDPLRSDAATYFGRALVEAGQHARAVTVLGPAIAVLEEAEGFEDVVALGGWALARAQVETGGDVAAAVTLAKASRAGLAPWPEEQTALDAWVAAHE